jgi:selenocysteine-specific elongation factor
MRRFVIGTAGHVDHGKTALVRALTGVETDRLPEEKRRGISIELGFAPWRLADDVRATVVDVPGHRRLVHTMIAGASGIELVLLVIAANEGVMPQTREHASVCEELGIRHAVVALTKSDLVDGETLALAEEEAKELLAGRFEVSVVSCSSVAKTGLKELRDTVAARLRVLPPWRGDGPSRLWVDRVFSVRGAGTVVTGTLSSGTVSRGEELALLGAGTTRLVVARELHVHDEVLVRAGSPTRLAVNLSVPTKDVHRGDLLTSYKELALTTSLDAELRGLRLKRGAIVSIHFGSAHVSAKVTRAEKQGDDLQVVRLALEEPRPLEGGDRFIARGAASCGGSVLDSRPHVRSRGAARRELLQALRAGDASRALPLLVAEVAPRPLSLGALRGRLTIPATALASAADAAAKRGELVVVGNGVMTKSTLLELVDLARALVAEHAVKAPLDRGLSVATLQRKLEDRAGPDAAEAAIRGARARRGKDDAGLIVIDGDVAVLEARRVDPALAGAVERARTELVAAGPHGVSQNAIAEATSAPADRARAMLAVLERQGAAVRAGDLWFAAEVVRQLREKLALHLARSPSITVIEFKALGALPRKQAVLLLEHFDQVGLTRRMGDARVLSRAG